METARLFPVEEWTVRRSPAVARLEALWRYLEGQGAVVVRVPTGGLSERTVAVLAEVEERRVRVLAEAVLGSVTELPREADSRHRHPTSRCT